MCDLGLCYENGDGVEEDLRHAVLWYRKSAEEGYAPGQCNLAVCYLNGNGVERDAAAAVRWLEKAAAQGNARAQSILGDLCRDGEAPKWMRRGPSSSIPRRRSRAIHPPSAPWATATRWGAARRRTRPKRWSGIEKAAQRGHATAQCNLAYCYEQGIGVAEDKTKAVEWYARAAEQEHPRAMCNLGLCYE